MRATGNRLWLAAGLVAVSLWPGVAVAASTITGTITFAGKAPTLRPLAMDADPACAKKHTGPVANEMLVLGGGSTMGNIMVWVSKGLPAGKTWPAPKTPVTLDQKAVSTTARDGNHGRSGLPDPQLRRHPPQRPRASQDQQGIQPADAGDAQGASATFDKAEAVSRIKCDVHLDERLRRRLHPHPFFSVTGTDGKFTISGLDPGTYEITAWHERLGTQTASVTVGANDTKTQNFKFAVPPRSRIRRPTA